MVDWKCKHHDQKALTDLIAVAAPTIAFRLWYWVMSWFQPLPLVSCLLVPTTCNTATLWIRLPGAFMGAYNQVRFGVSCLGRVYLEAGWGVCLRASWELTWERIVKPAGSVQWSAIQSVFENVFRNAVESNLWAYLVMYCLPGREYMRECAQKSAWKCQESPGAWNEVHWAVLLNATWCVVLSAQNHIGTIVI